MYMRVLYAIVINLPLLMPETIGILRKAGGFGVNHPIRISNRPKPIEIDLQRIPGRNICIRPQPVPGMLLCRNIGKQ